MVPLGYDCLNRKLVVNQAEAHIVRDIFRNYLRLGCVRKLKGLLDRRLIRSKVRRSAEGKTSGGRPFSRGALYHLLNNQIYLGEVVHKKACYTGQHDAIVSRRLWDQVTARLKENNQAHRTGKSRSSPSLLSGKLFDTNGVRFTPTHAVKRGKRYRYYTSQAAVQHAGVKPAITRFPAHQLECFVLSQIQQLLGKPEDWGIEASPSASAAAERARELEKVWLALPTEKQYELVRTSVERVIVGVDTVWIEIDRGNLLRALLRDSDYSANSAERLGILRIAGKFNSVRRGTELRVVCPNKDNASQRESIRSLVNVVARARYWYDQIVSGNVASIHQLASETGLGPRHMRRILQCAMLSPTVTDALLTGRHRQDLTVNQLLKKVPLDWREQERHILNA